MTKIGQLQGTALQLAVRGASFLCRCQPQELQLVHKATAWLVAAEGSWKEHIPHVLQELLWLPCLFPCALQSAGGEGDL